MIVQFNTDHNIHGSEQLRDKFITLIKDELSKYSSRLTRIEIHLTDEDGKKNGMNDKRCVLEARIEGMQPIAVTSHANTYDQVIDGAIEKIKSSFETIFGRLNNH